MSISPLNHPVNILVCQTSGTIFSTGGISGGGGGGSSNTFSNLGATGARVYAQTISNNVQFRRITQGANVVVTERATDILVDVNDLAFDSTPPVKRAIPGLQGVSLGKQGIIKTLQELLYPTIAPVVSISLNTGLFEYGDNSPLVASWAVTRTDETINTIQVDVVSISPVTGNSQAGVQNINKTGLVPVTVPLVATTATKNAATSATASVSRKVRVGPSGKDGVVSPILDSDVQALAGFYTPSRLLAPQTIVIGVNQYLVIEIPTAYGGIPIFKINGFVNNAFTKVRTTSNFTNSFGFVEPVDVYVSNIFSTGTLTVEIA